MNLTSGSSLTPTFVFLLHCLSQSVLWSAHSPHFGDQGSELAVAYEISCKLRRRRCLISQQSSNLRWKVAQRLPRYTVVSSRGDVLHRLALTRRKSVPVARHSSVKLRSVLCSCVARYFGARGE
jgi:hypothetical protein